MALDTCWWHVCREERQALSWRWPSLGALRQSPVPDSLLRWVLVSCRAPRDRAQGKAVRLWGSYHTLAMTSCSWRRNRHLSLLLWPWVSHGSMLSTASASTRVPLEPQQLLAWPCHQGLVHLYLAEVFSDHLFHLILSDAFAQRVPLVCSSLSSRSPGFGTSFPLSAAIPVTLQVGLQVHLISFPNGKATTLQGDRDKRVNLGDGVQRQFSQNPISVP